jgi:gamma-glutamylputrescine oxidase
VTRTRYGVSPWIDEVPKRRRPDFPRFRGNGDYPIVIIGGGLAGIFSAYAFAAAGIKVTLLEADRLGLAGASRSPGILHGEATSSYRGLETRVGRKAARAMFEASRRAVLDVATAARRLGARNIDTHDALRVLSSYSADEKALARDAQARRDAGIDVTILKAAAISGETRLETTRLGLRLRDWGHANPYELAMTFARAAAERGAAIFEKSAVRRVKVGRKGADLVTDGGTLRADTVVVCTGEPTDLYRPLKRHLRFDERYVVLTERLPASLRKQVSGKTRLITDTETPPHTVLLRDDGRLLVAGADQGRTSSRNKDKVVRQRTGQLMYELSRMFPAVSGVMPEFGWDVPIATSSDEAMYAGPHRNFPRHLFAWGTRHDPAQAFLASRILLRHYLGEADRNDLYFAFTRG